MRVDLTEASSRRGGSVPLQGYLALPSGAGPWPGVVVVHEIFGRAFRDIETARLTLLERTDVTDRLGIIGFCMGGGFALLTADADRYAAASVNYGILPKDLDSVATLCPVVGSYGAQDRALRGAAGRLSAALDGHRIKRDVKEYSEVGHSFLNELPTGPRPMQPLFRVLGVTAEPEVISDAWGRIDAFFAAHLGSSRE